MVTDKDDLAETTHQPSNLRFETSRRIRWSEVNAHGDTHFSNYVRLMEETEYEFLRSRGLSVVLQDERGILGFPRLNVKLKIVQPARFNDLVYTTLELIHFDFKMIEYHFEIVNEMAELIAIGSFRAACCRFPPDKPPYAILTPEFVIEALKMPATK